ncbi:MAG TPA: acetyl-CoA C-acetyltransferase [Bacillus sp. (in: firmicutes)]|uniref:thiolase family protein n=1 Tax=Bacillus litorisediminis TaxID=2922713 RepID=UPI001FB019D5|nr:acetyl-CoA C-acetyltransferase [Bacillus litorisediminis]HWO75259.1 acetyl-CoA C-acetyltransferase [Bacillus sp. (in: firmicutes)]
MNNQVYLIEGARTPFTSFGGSLAAVNAEDLGSITALEALKRAKVEASSIDHVIYGNVIHSYKNAAYLSRHIGLKAGVPKEVPAYTVNRLCGSGLQAVVSAGQHILLGEADVVLAGGSENMSMSPYSNFQARLGSIKYGPLNFEDMLLSTLTDDYAGIGMGITAEKLAERYQISREEQDAFSLLSQQRASEARKNGIFAKEIVEVEVPSRNGSTFISVDQHIREDVTMASLSALRPSFKKDGTVTPGNSSGINDGAATVVVASKKAVDEKGLTPLVKIVSWGIAGVDPEIMGIGPVPAIRQALDRAHLSLSDIDLFEVNEAFAAQFLAVERELGLDRDKTNVNGGAIALGHPVGASGTRVLLSLAYELKRRGGQFGVASLCIGGGQGIAVVIENV